MRQFASNRFTITAMGKFAEAYSSLNHAQKEAVDNIEGPVLVIAGPGTGKTNLLSVRVANILRSTDTKPSNILCLTYTESGQLAMNSRLRQLMPKEGRQVEVLTFHGFGNYLISKYPQFFSDIEGFKPADDLALYEALRACFERLPHKNPLSKKAYGQFIYQKDAASRISQLKQAGLTPEEAAITAIEELNWSSEHGQLLADIFRDSGRLSTKTLQTLANSLHDFIKEARQGCTLAKNCIDELNQALELSNDTNKTAPLTEFKKKWLKSEDGSLLFRPANQLKKLKLLVDIYDSYEKELRARKLYDYDDMILYALQKLETNEELKSNIQEQFHYILADEYQDTNLAQSKIINLLADNPVNEDRPNVMVVGDDDQAIYGFQGAQGNALSDFKNRWKLAKIITLTDNYRSSQDILDTARSVILKGTDRLEDLSNDINKALTARSKIVGMKPVLLMTSDAASSLQKAAEIAKNAPKTQELAFIASKHKYLKQLAAELDKQKISYHYEGKENLLKDDEVISVILLTRIVSHLLSDNPAAADYLLPEFIARQHFTFSRESAWQIAVESKRSGRSWWQTMMDSPLEDAIRLVNAIKELVDSTDPADALQALNSVTKSIKLNISFKLSTLIDHSKKYLQRDDVSVQQFLKYIDLCLLADINLGLNIEQGSRESNIRLLSAHKSKGLEFDHVYVLNADNYTWFREKGRQNILSLPSSWKFIEPTADVNSEKLRLLYVVLTRAKSGLSLISSRKNGNRDFDYLPGLESIKSLDLKNETPKQQMAINDNEPGSWFSWYRPADTKQQIFLKELLTEEINKYRLNPSHLTLYLDLSHGGPDLFLANVLLGIKMPVSPEAIFGSYVHKLLHFSQLYLNKTGKLPTRTELGAHSETLSDNSNDHLSSDAVDLVDDFLRKTEYLSPGGISEYSFSSEKIEVNGIRLTGTVDHYYKDISEQLIVSDYKTGRAFSSWKVNDDYYKQKLHRAKQQLRFYKLLFIESKNFNDVKDYILRVIFVEPNANMQYYDLGLDDNPAEDEELLRLIESVWVSICEIDFPNIGSYTPNFDGVMKLEADMISKNLLQ